MKEPREALLGDRWETWPSGVTVGGRNHRSEISRSDDAAVRKIGGPENKWPENMESCGVSSWRKTDLCRAPDLPRNHSTFIRKRVRPAPGRPKNQRNRLVPKESASFSDKLSPIATAAGCG